MSTIYVGIDNGASGSIGVLGLPGGPKYFPPPTKKHHDYTKVKNQITRIDWEGLVKAMLNEVVKPVLEANSVGADLRVVCVLERPFVNPGMFKTTGRALRALESTLIMLEHLGLPFQYCDSRGWQKLLLPQGLKGSPALKKASKEVGCRLFPELEAQIKKQKDADGLLIAEWARREAL